MSEHEIEIYAEYMAKWPNSISRLKLNTNDKEFMAELILKMNNALEENKPLNDLKVFGLDSSFLMAM
jgi:hypothetical protein